MTVIHHVTDDDRNFPLAQLTNLLLTLNPDEANMVRESCEYRDLLQLVENIKKIHTQNETTIVEENNTNTNTDAGMSMQVRRRQDRIELSSFLQQKAADDVLSKILDFLDCRDLIQTLPTCSRLYGLVQINVKRRTKPMSSGRHLNNSMQLLRAQEQINGIGAGVFDICVPVPILLLKRRIIVTNSGDAEYNGVYFCTGLNGNGFVFTKPRCPEQRLDRAVTADSSIRMLDADPVVETEGEGSETLLRCIIAKRFSNEVRTNRIIKEYVNRMLVSHHLTTFLHQRRFFGILARR
jgi:hypothetical protein